MTMTVADMAVRFWDQQSSKERIEYVRDEEGAAEVLARLLAWGTKGEIVTRERMDPPPWTVDRRAQERLDRQYVESTVELLAEEEIALRDACDRLRLIATGLTHPADVRTRTEEGKAVTRLIATGLRIDDECLLATWLERAANLRDECADLRDGAVEKADTNDEMIGAEFESHLNVLANLADHGVGEYGCTKCTVSAPAKKAEVAA